MAHQLKIAVLDQWSSELKGTRFPDLMSAQYNLNIILFLGYAPLHLSIPLNPSPPGYNPKDLILLGTQESEGITLDHKGSTKNFEISQPLAHWLQRKLQRLSKTKTEHHFCNTMKLSFNSTTFSEALDILHSSSQGNTISPKIAKGQ